MADHVEKENIFLFVPNLIGKIDFFHSFLPFFCCSMKVRHTYYTLHIQVQLETSSKNLCTLAKISMSNLFWPSLIFLFLFLLLLLLFRRLWTHHFGHYLILFYANKLHCGRMVLYYQRSVGCYWWACGSCI